MVRITPGDMKECFNLYKDKSEGAEKECAVVFGIYAEQGES